MENRGQFYAEIEQAALKAWFNGTREDIPASFITPRNLAAIGAPPHMQDKALAMAEEARRGVPAGHGGGA